MILVVFSNLNDGGGGVTDPGGVQRAFGCCVEGHGLAGTIGNGRTVGLDDLVGPFQPCDSMILYKKRPKYMKI